MAEITVARIVGDWRRVVGDEIVTHETPEIGDAGIHGTVTLTPIWAKSGPYGVIADPAAHYSIHPVVCRVRYGRLYDPTNTHPYEDIVVEIGGHPLVWSVTFDLTFRHRTGEPEVPLQVRGATFDSSAMVAGQVSLTGILPTAAVPDEYQSYFADAAVSAGLAEAARSSAELAAAAADVAAGVASAKADAAAASVGLAAAEADRAVGLSTAQDQAVADTVLAGGPTTTALNATYASQAQVGAQPPRPLASPAYTNATIAPIEFFDGTLWGVSGQEIHKSSDEGATWTLHATAPSGASPVRRLLPCDDGGVLVVGATGVVKATGWTTTPAFSSMKVTVNGLARISSFQADGNGTKFIVAEYGPGESSRIDSRYAHISTDMGETWTRVYDSVALQGAAADISHVHGCCYDPWEDVFYVAEGHTVGSAGLWLSRDDGATWTLYDGYKVDSSPTVLVATDDGLVLGSDDARAGLMGIPRVGPIEDRQVIHTWIWRATNDGVLGFGIQGQRDPETGVVYIGFHTAIPGLPPVIAAGTATSGALVHTHPVGSGASNGDRFASLALLPSGKVLARAEVGGGGETMSAWRTNVGPSTQDAGGVGGGVAPQNTSIAVGKTNTGSASRSIAAGMGAVVESDSVAVGYESVAPTNSVAVGRGAVSRQGSTVVGYLASASPDGVQDNRNSVAVGYLAKVSGNAAVSIGASATAVIQSIAIGSGASTTGQDAVGIGRGVTAPTNATIVGSGASANDNTVAVGRLASTTGGAAAALGANATSAVSGVAVGAAANAGSSGTALGRNTVASGNNSVAIGRDTVADQAFQVAVGPRDIEVQDAAKGLVLKSPDGTRYRVTVEDGGTLAVTTA